MAIPSHTGMACPSVGSWLCNSVARPGMAHSCYFGPRVPRSRPNRVTKRRHGMVWLDSDRSSASTIVRRCHGFERRAAAVTAAALATASDADGLDKTPMRTILSTMRAASRGSLPRWLPSATDLKRRLGPGSAEARGLIFGLRSSFQIKAHETAPANISEKMLQYYSRSINRES